MIEGLCRRDGKRRKKSMALKGGEGMRESKPKCEKEEKGGDGESDDDEGRTAKQSRLIWVNRSERPKAQLSAVWISQGRQSNRVRAS